MCVGTRSCGAIGIFFGFNLHVHVWPVWAICVPPFHTDGLAVLFACRNGAERSSEMINVKLTASVGKMGANKPADVKILQTCLGAIKVKMKPLYKGKVDGKAGKDLIEAICCFQQMEKIKPTGKASPGDQTMSKLKMRTPSSVKLPSDAAMQQAGVAQKVNSAVNATVKEVTSAAPLPPEDAKALAKIIQDAGKLGIALKMKDFRLTEGGRIRIELEQMAVSGVPLDTSTAAKSDLAKKVTAIVQRSSRWIGGSSSNLVFMTLPVDPTLQAGLTPTETGSGSDTGL